MGTPHIISNSLPQLKLKLSIEKLLFVTSFLKTVPCNLHPAASVVSPVAEHHEGGGAGQEGAGEPEGQARRGDEDQGGEVGGALSRRFKYNLTVNQDNIKYS